MKKGAKEDESPYWVLEIWAPNSEYLAGQPHKPAHFDVQFDGREKPGDHAWGGRSEEEFHAVHKAFGWTPISAVTFAACRNRDSDHYALAGLSAEIADRVDGVIDVNGKLPLPTPLLTSQLANRQIVEVPYEVDGGGIGVIQIVTPAFLRGWRRDEQFRMVK